MLCSHFGECGGCSIQNSSYLEQLELKENYVKKLFREILQSDLPISPIIGCDSSFEYRNKMEFSFRESKNAERYLGLRMAKRGGRVVNINHCLLCSKWMSEVLEAVRKWWLNTHLEAYFPPKDKGTLRTLMLREGKRTEDQMVMLTISGKPEYDLQEEEARSFFASVDAVLSKSNASKANIIIRKQIAEKGIPTWFEERILQGSGKISEELFTMTNRKLTFSIRPDAFFQTNTLQAEKIYQTAISMLEIQKSDIVYDLYCGTGTIALFAAEKARHVIGIELCHAAWQDALENKKNCGIENVDFFQGDVSDVLAKNKELPAPDSIIVDPPRAGLTPKTILEIQKLLPKKILYISCNPVTQVENLKEFLKSGYVCLSIQPIDQFPHTLHIENIVLLESNL